MKNTLWRMLFYLIIPASTILFIYMFPVVFLIGFILAAGWMFYDAKTCKNVKNERDY